MTIPLFIIFIFIFIRPFFIYTFRLEGLAFDLKIKVIEALLKNKNKIKEIEASPLDGIKPIFLYFSSLILVSPTISSNFCIIW